MGRCSYWGLGRPKLSSRRDPSRRRESGRGTGTWVSWPLEASCGDGEPSNGEGRKQTGNVAQQLLPHAHPFWVTHRHGSSVCTRGEGSGVSFFLWGSGTNSQSEDVKETEPPRRGKRCRRSSPFRLTHHSVCDQFDGSTYGSSV